MCLVRETRHSSIVCIPKPLGLRQLKKRRDVCRLPHCPGELRREVWSDLARGHLQSSLMWQLRDREAPGRWSQRREVWLALRERTVTWKSCSAAPGRPGHFSTFCRVLSPWISARDQKTHNPMHRTWGCTSPRMRSEKRSRKIP